LGVDCNDLTSGSVFPVRVMIVAESFTPSVNGVTGSVLQVLAHLRRSGHPAVVAAPDGGPDDHDGTPVLRMPAVSVPGAPELPVGLPTRRLQQEMARFGPDVVHLASPFVLGAGGLAAAHRLGVPTVAVYQTDVAGFVGAYGAGTTARAAWRWSCRLHRQADRTLAPSAATVEALTAAGVDRVHLWGRGVDAARFAPARRDPVLRARLASGDELLVGYVGRLAPEKQVERLAALSRVAGVRLVVVGDGPTRTALEDRLPAAAFLGMLAGDELARAYATLDVFVHTGPFDTFGQAVQEAMASGVPVVALDAGGPRELVRHGHSGYLVPPDDPGALQAAVLRLRDDAVLRHSFSRAARLAVRGRSWPAVCDELLDHYRAVVDPPVARAA
jgi:phosphatidylinositol alpha 1,6-mannosyltransferase